MGANQIECIVYWYNLMCIIMKVPEGKSMNAIGTAINLLGDKVR